MRHLSINVVFFLFTFMPGVTAALAADITSTAKGGLWDDKSTWIGGILPTDKDNVFITSVVTTGHSYYTSTTIKMVNLTVNAGGKIIREKDKVGRYLLEVSGNLINNGEIIDYKDFFDISLTGNLTNNGIFKPRFLDMVGSNQKISGSSAIEPRQINLNMKDEFVLAASDLIFKNCQVRSGISSTSKKLNMNKFSLSLIADSIGYGWGTVNSSSEFAQPIVFDGTGILTMENSIVRGTITGNVIVKSPGYAFLGDLTVEGSLTLDKGAKVSGQNNNQRIRVKGDFTNYANLNKDTVKVRKVEFTPRSMNLIVIGNSNNFGSSGITTVYPTTNGKTISLKGNYDGNVYVQQAENTDKPGGKVLINSEVNISGKFDVYANLEIGQGGTLNLLNKELHSPIYLPSTGVNLTNNGIFNRYHRVANSWGSRSFSAQPGTHVDFELREWSDRIEGVDVSVYNQQTYPGLPGSVKRWWRLTPTGTGKVKAYTLKLYYDDSMLNGQKEKNLKVYRSVNKGETWEVVSVGEFSVIDTIQNTITIGRWDRATSMMSEFGDFVISAGDGSVPIASPIMVNVVGNTNVRLGAPNRYTVHLYNLTNFRTESFMAAVTVSDDIVFKQIEIPGKTGKTIIPIDSIGTKKDHTQLFFVPYLDPNEEYSFDVIVTGVNPGTKSSKVGGPSLTVTGLGKFGAKEKIEDLIAAEISALAELDDQEAREYARGMGLTVKQLEIQKEKEGIGTFAVKTVAKYAVEQAANTNPLTKIAFKIGSAVELVSKVKDSYRRRIWHWLYKEVGLYGVDEIKVVSGKNVEGKMVSSWDPNEKLGPTGYGLSNHIASAGKMNYTILFENLKEATAPAYRVQIVDTLSAVFDPATVKFGATSHSGPNYNWKMERIGNILKWDIEGIELPPNATPPEGEGFVTFSVDLNKNLPSGTEIKNRASIVFDINKPIITNIWKNIIDMEAPKTVMNPIKYASGDKLITVSCQSTDNVNGSGANKYLFFGSVNNSPFSLLGESYKNSIEYPVSVTSENSYRFYALATDNVSNAELKVPAIAELKSIPVSSRLTEHSTDHLKIYPNPTSGIISIEFFTEIKTPVNFQLYSVTGEILKIDRIGLSEAGTQLFTIDISDLKQGVYFAKVIYNNKEETFKVIKN